MREKARLFLEHLEATPADAATRLVFADWLEDELGLRGAAAIWRDSVTRPVQTVHCGVSCRLEGLEPWTGRRVPLWSRVEPFSLCSASGPVSRAAPVFVVAQSREAGEAVCLWLRGEGIESVEVEIRSDQTMPQVEYREFLERKSQGPAASGFAPVWLPDCLFDFQKHLVEWAIMRGRAAIFADCGLGKSLMQLVWAANVARKASGNVLIIAPLAVAAQTAREAAKFGIDARVSRDGTVHDGITITNYERLHYFDPKDFAGAVADESSAIKAFDGRRRKQVVRFFSKLPYRLLCTATPSPNDFIELGTQSECLGVMTQSDMLGFFFREADDKRHTVFRDEDISGRQKWFFKPHSEQPFWRWVSSWARALRSPADLGFDGSRFVLPPLVYEQHITEVPFIPAGELFPRPAITIREQREERHRSLRPRCEKVAELLTHDRPAIAWCHFNEESELLAELIPGAVEVAGKHSDDFKEAALNDFAKGNIRVLVSKPKIACWGMNYQHCGDMTIFPSFSFEQFYQAVRRCWRFGREGPVTVGVVSALGEADVIAGLKRKQEQSETMFASLVKYMNNAIAMCSNDGHDRPTSVPAWLKVEV